MDWRAGQPLDRNRHPILPAIQECSVTTAGPTTHEECHISAPKMLGQELPSRQDTQTLGDPNRQKSTCFTRAGYTRRQIPFVRVWMLCQICGGRLRWLGCLPPLAAKVLLPLADWPKASRGQFGEHSGDVVEPVGSVRNSSSNIPCRGCIQ